MARGSRPGAQATAPGAAAATLLARLGGATGVARLVEAFHAAMHEREDARTILAMHDGDFAETGRVLTGYLREWLSRPSPADDGRGMPALARRHAPFPIDAAARDAWLACMGEALGRIGTAPALRDELLEAFAAVAERMRNLPGQAVARDPARADRAAAD